MPENIFFELDFIAVMISAVVCAGLFLIWKWHKRFPRPHLLFSNLALIPTVHAWRASLPKLDRALQYGALGVFFLAFIDPHFQRAKPYAINPPPKEGIAIYLLTDTSGSMREKIHTTGFKNEPITIPKIDLLRQITTQFVQGNPSAGLKGRPNDLIGLVAFARTANVLAPLSFDHRSLLKSLASLSTAPTKEEDGTAMGYALFKTVNLIVATRHYAEDFIGNARPAYEIKSSIIILVTDGFPDPNPLDQGNKLRNMDLLTAAQFAKEKNIKVYLVTIDPALASNEFTAHRHLMERVAELTGGKYYLISDANGLSKIYKDIDSLEKSILPNYNLLSKDQQPNRYDRISLYPYLIALGILLLGVSVGVKTLLARQIP